MKNSIISLVALAAMLASCSKNETESTSTPPMPDLSAPIALTAGVQATTESKAAVEGTTFPERTSSVFFVTAFANATTAPMTDWSATPYFANMAVNSGAASALAFATAQYYPANGDKVYFYAYAPTPTSLIDGTVSLAPIAEYTITGQEDIMAAQVVTGIAKVAAGQTQLQPALAFTHKLKQVKFKLVADASFDITTPIAVTSITVTAVKTDASLSIGDGTLTFGTTTGDLLLPITPSTNDQIIATPGTAMDGCLMFEPGATFNLSVVADGVTYLATVTLSGTSAGEAGVSHLVTLTFKRSGIVPTATITNWTTGDPSGADIM